MNSYRPRLIEAITLSELGGAQGVVAHLLKGLKDRFDITLVCGGDGDLVAFARNLGLRVHSLPTLGRAISPSSDFTALRELIAVCRHLQPQIIHLHSSKMGVLGSVAGRLSGADTVFTVHGWAWEGFGPLAPYLRTMQRAVLMHANVVVCVSRTDLATAHASGLKRAKYIPNGVDLPVSVKRHCTGSPTVIGSVGRVAPQKDPHRFLAVADLVLQRCPDAQFVWIGGGPLLEQMRERTSLGDGRVVFRGEEANARDRMSEFDVLLLTSRWEGLPLVALEACGAGLPIVTTRAGGVVELVRDRWNGFLADDVPSLAEAVCTLVGDPAVRGHMGVNSRAVAVSYTADRMVREYRELFDNLLSHGMQRGG